MPMSPTDRIMNLMSGRGLDGPAMQAFHARKGPSGFLMHVDKLITDAAMKAEKESNASSEAIYAREATKLASVISKLDYGNTPAQVGANPQARMKKMGFK